MSVDFIGLVLIRCVDIIIVDTLEIEAMLSSKIRTIFNTKSY